MGNVTFDPEIPFCSVSHKQIQISDWVFTGLDKAVLHGNVGVLQPSTFPQHTSKVFRIIYYIICQ
jgi:hypothetical protein